MKKTIKRRLPEKDYLQLKKSLDSHSLILGDIFQSRGAQYGKQNDYSLKNLIPPTELAGLDKAIALLFTALEKQQRILIIGDFDADGATSTAVAVKCLKLFGAHYVDFLVPNRFIFGYGLTPEIVGEAVKFDPDLIVTVDNGISSMAGVAAAKAAGIAVLVTDHHLPAKETPAADAIVNPNQKGCCFPSKNLAGVGVIFYLMSALRTYLREKNWFQQQGIAEPNMASLLDLVALGTVADVVPLDYNNRILVAAGLERMRSGRITPGIKAMINIAGKDIARLSSTDLGFAVGPRLNAAGRLDDMSLGIKCLLAENPAEAMQLARELDELNRDRKLIESSMQDEALKLLGSLNQDEIARQHGVCLYQADWHQGVIGILASRIKDRLHRPTIVFADADSGDLNKGDLNNGDLNNGDLNNGEAKWAEIKGSGRSIPGVHLRDVLDEIAATNEGLLNKFGGHAMAAGLTIQRESLAQFKAAFNSVIEKHLNEDIIEPLVLSDGELPEALCDIHFAQCIKEAGPWGQHFPEPVFDGVFQLVQQRIVGGKYLKLRLTQSAHSDTVYDAIAFTADMTQWPNESVSQARLAYHLDINEYRGETKVQMLVTYIEPA